jgi:NAD+ synthase (glutamine-hydrolysing)
MKWYRAVAIKDVAYGAGTTNLMKKISFAIAQMNPTVGDYAGNARKIISWIKQAEKKKADLVVFPEIALSGYPVWDLANKKSFVSDGMKQLDAIVRSTRNLNITAVLGYIEENDSADGRNWNAMAWISKGRILARYHKRLLPTYDVFLEDIFFQAGSESRPIPWRSLKVGPTICEDIWDARYKTKPVQELARQKSDLLINISASPYYLGVINKRDELVSAHSKRHRIPMLYVNQVGAQDDLIFDGRSFFADADGRILFRAPGFHEGLFYFDWDASKKEPYEVPRQASANTIAEVYEALVLGIRDYCRKNGFKKVVIGLSGGIDSALVAALAVEALGPDAVLGVTMPGTFSSKGSWKDSEDLAERLGIEIRVNPIKKLYQQFLKEAKKSKLSLATENLQARLRGLKLMFISNDEGRLVLTTGNKSELAMGYCTLYGDMAGGLSVIGDVYKTDVYRLAWYINREKEIIPHAILEKAPSAELRPNQKDEDSLPPYELLDQILYLYIEKNKSAQEILSGLKTPHVSLALVRDVIRRVDHNEYKRRQTPPILRVTEKAWFGRRMPITNRFQQ